MKNKGFGDLEMKGIYHKHLQKWRFFSGAHGNNQKIPRDFPPGFSSAFSEPRRIPLGYHLGSLSELGSLLGSASSWIPEPCSDITGHEVEPKNMQPATCGLFVVGWCWLFCCCVVWLVGCGCRPCPVLLVFPFAWLFQPPKKVEPPNKRRKTSPTTAYSEIPLMVQKSGKLTSWAW